MNSNLDARLGQLSKEKRALLERRLRERKSQRRIDTVIPRRQKGEAVRLSYEQQRLWFLDRIASDKSVYNVPLLIKLSGDLDVDCLERALGEILRRHEALRTNFRLHGEIPFQESISITDFRISRHSLSHVQGDDQERELAEYVNNIISQPFDLASELLIRAVLVSLAESQHVLIINFHHIICDGWSLDIFCRELSVAYNNLLTGQRPHLTELPVQYADFAMWQRSESQGELLKRQLQYWMKQLNGCPAGLELPTVQPRPSTRSQHGQCISKTFSVELSTAIKTFAERQGATPFMILLAAVKSLLNRYTSQKDIVVGTAAAGRKLEELQGIMGCFVNTLVLRTVVSEKDTFATLLQKIKNTVLDAIANQDLPFDKLIEDLRPVRQQSQSPLFNVMFAFQSSPVEHVALNGLSAELVDVESTTSKFDLSFLISERQRAFTATIEFSTDLFDPGFVSRMLGHFNEFVKTAIENPECLLSDIDYLTDDERSQLEMWGNSQKCYSEQNTINELFDEQVRKFPHNIAVSIGEGTLTYRELDTRANQLANFLRQRGAKCDELIGVCMDRSLEMIVSLIAILKAGGAFVPLDPAYPKERLQFMVDDTRLRLILTQMPLRHYLSGTSAELVCVDDCRSFAKYSSEDPKAAVTSENLAYVMYTSGSTGRPKGACVPHRAVVRLVRNCNFAHLGSDEVILQFAPISFDASTLEIWGSLLKGGKLILYPERIGSLKDLAASLQRNRVTTLWLTAGLFHQMVDENLAGLNGVRQLLAGGDVLSVPHVRRAAAALPECNIINGYGPTENTTFSCCYSIQGKSIANTSIPIGTPIDNTYVRVLDKRMNPVPVGISGELYVGGEGLARGYLNRPELTSTKFVPDPFRAGARLYRTGDEVRFLSNGNIEFLGRVDNQVKIRGFRIEPGEIEALLRQHPGVREAVVIPHADTAGGKRLVAYVSAMNGTMSIDEIRAHAKAKLPDYMVPSTIMKVDGFSLSPNGKIDRRKLPQPIENAITVSENKVKPWLAIHIQLLRIWESLLRVKNIGLQDDFFALGGHSLLAATMVDRIERECGIKVPLSTLFSAPTIQCLSEVILSEQPGGKEAEYIKIQNGRGRMPFFYLDGDLQGGGFYCRNLAREMGPDTPFYSIRPGPSLHPGSIKEQAQNKVKILRKLRPHGPYLLGGFCIDALVAFEAACQLQRDGESIQALILIDPPTYPSTFRMAAHLLRGVARCSSMSPEATLRAFKRCLTLREVIRMENRHRTHYLKQRTKRFVQELFSRKSSTDNKLPAPDVDVLTAHLWSAIAYHPGRFAGSARLVVSSELMNNQDYPAVQWRKHVQHLDIHSIPGEHLGIITRHVDLLGRELKSCVVPVPMCAASGRMSECLLSAS